MSQFRDQIYRRKRTLAQSSILALNREEASLPQAQAKLEGIGDRLSFERFDYEPPLKSENIASGLVNLTFANGHDSPDGGNGILPFSWDRVDVMENDFSVLSLLFQKKVSDPVLVPGGMLFLGGAQNRTLQHGTILKEESEERPVFCVELKRWDKDYNVFNESVAAPAFLTFNFLRNQILYPQAQERIWDGNYELLSSTNHINPTFNLVDMVGQGDNDRDGLQEKKQAHEATLADFWYDRHAPGKRKGYFYINNDLGFFYLSVRPNRHFHQEELSRWVKDLHWHDWFNEQKNNMYYEYFRVFDKGLRVAVRCMPNGQTLKDIYGRPMLFYYNNDDLAEPVSSAIVAPHGQAVASYHEAGSNKIQLEVETLNHKLDECLAYRPFGRGPWVNFYHPQEEIYGQMVAFDRDILSLDVYGMAA